MDNKIIRRDGRVYLVMHTIEPIECEDGHIEFGNYDREEDITGREDREHPFCKICKFGKYPQCMDTCDDIKSGG